MSYTGWLSPAGELIKCDGYAHLAKAMDIVTCLGWNNNNLHADEILLKHGWMRISRKTYGDCGLVFFVPTILSFEQMRYLEIISEDNETISEEGKQTLIRFGIT